MSEVVIKVENLSKNYQIRHVNEESYQQLSEELLQLIKRPFRAIKKRFSSSTRSTGQETSTSLEEFWALTDVSFSVAQGEVVGVIGRNGAGKSTLLKILSRITEPSSGRVCISGRVASLLEVGTGFHPELTGRENILLNGAILGMTRLEIKKRFDEIVEFAEVEKFLDTPVKRYSSGMYVRLAFAVAAHLEPEILIVDEVLAVGDFEFQRKCLGKIGEIATGGRTVLFVSHNMSAVRSLCNRAIWLAGGKVAMSGECQTVLDGYLRGNQFAQCLQYFPEIGQSLQASNQTEPNIIDLMAFRICRTSSARLTNGDDIEIEAVVLVRRPTNIAMCVPVYRFGEPIFYANSYHILEKMRFHRPGQIMLRMTVPKYLLNPGEHEFSIYLTDQTGHHHFVHEERVIRTNIEEDGVRRGNSFHSAWPGAVSPVLPIDVVELSTTPEWVKERKITSSN
jgi:lipopolysaccharide transport system ATP-binding protein